MRDQAENIGWYAFDVSIKVSLRKLKNMGSTMFDLKVLLILQIAIYEN